MERLSGLATMGPAIGVGVGYAFLALIVITLDRFRATGTSKDDNQVELKILLFALALAALFLGAEGIHAFLAWALGGFKGGFDSVKILIGPILVGGGLFAVILAALLPRTNTATARAAEAIALLSTGLYFGITAMAGANGLITSLLSSQPWELTSFSLATLAVNGVIGVAALIRLGSIAGWKAPAPRAAPPPAQYPPQGYPPQGGGYPPQGGGYPPQGGGYPPQGGGYPPQGGGYPPQGGGYPR